MLSGLPNLTDEERGTLLWAYALQGDVASVRRALTDLPRDRAAAREYMRAQAWLWRMEHGLPPGDVPRSPAFWLSF